MKAPCAAACLTVLIALSLSSRAAGANPDTQFKSIYEKEWAWRQAQRGEEDDDAATASHRKVKAQLPKVDAATQEAKLRYWTNVLQELDGIKASSLLPPSR